MRVREEREIIVVANPDELRNLADKMEKRYEELTIGQTTFVDFLGYQDGFKVCLHLDQEWFMNQRKA